MISIDEMEKMLDELASELPEEFYKELNGGIILLPETKFHNNKNADDLYILGEYHQEVSLGRYICIYYGSFLKVYGYLSKDKIRPQLRKVLRHEFRHHLESLAGERLLEIEDEQYILDYLKRYNHTNRSS